MAKPGRFRKGYVTGAEKVVNRLRTIRASTATVLHGDHLQDLLLKRTKERFLKQVDPDGNKWRPLAQATLDDKIKRGKRTAILQRTGLLYNSIAIIKRNQTTLASATGAGFSIGVINSNDGEYGSDPGIYGRAHQFGTGRVPKRRFLGMGPLDVKAVDSMLRREILTKNGIR